MGKNIITKHALDDKVGTIWLSPMFNIQENTSHAPKLATDLAEWILKTLCPFGLAYSYIKSFGQMLRANKR